MNLTLNEIKLHTIQGVVWYSSAVECLPDMYKALGSTLGPSKQTNKQQTPNQSKSSNNRYNSSHEYIAFYGKKFLAI